MKTFSETTFLKLTLNYPGICYWFHSNTVSYVLFIYFDHWARTAVSCIHWNVMTIQRLNAANIVLFDCDTVTTVKSCMIKIACCLLPANKP